MTRAEKIWSLHRIIVDPTSDDGTVRRSKRALLVALATPERRFRANIPGLKGRTRKVAHLQQFPFSVEAGLP